MIIKHFEEFDYIVAVHTDIIDSLMDIAPRHSHAKLLLLGDFDPEGERNMRDPFYVNGLLVIVCLKAFKKDFIFF